jgi:AraC-like DNA-binding protein
MPAPKPFSRITTDETLLENVRHGSPAFPLQYYYEDIWDFDFHCVDWHWHPELEYVYVQSGQAICFVGNEKLTVDVGCGLLINSRVIHRFVAESSTIIPNVVYSPSLLAPENSLLYQKYLHTFISSGADYILFDPSVPWQAVCIQRMMEVFASQEKKDVEEINTVTSLLGFWNELYQHRQFEHDTFGKKPDRTNQTRLQIMMQYIQEHYQENLRLEDIGAAVHIGRSLTLQVFQQGIHQSPIAYLIEFRLKQAAKLLTSTEKNVGRIAEETGFESSTYFCRKFRELYGKTPKDYRNKWNERISRGEEKEQKR